MHKKKSPSITCQFPLAIGILGNLLDTDHWRKQIGLRSDNKNESLSMEMIVRTSQTPQVWKSAGHSRAENPLKFEFEFWSSKTQISKSLDGGHMLLRV